MAHYRSKSIIIDAYQWRPHVDESEHAEPRPDWFTAAIALQSIVENREVLEVGGQRASANDWVVRGVGGELNVCKPDIFSLSYEAWDGAAT